MSPSALRTIPVTEGSAARVLTELPTVIPLEPPARKSRAPLSLVVSTPRRARSPLAAIVALMVLAAMAVVLVMSISVAKGQYLLVDLKSQQSELIKINQTMEQDIAANQAPQELAARAAALGMVPAGSTGQIDVRTKTVSGSPLPASADTKGLVNIPPAVVDKPRPKVEPEVPLSPAAKIDAKKSAEKPQNVAPVPAPVIVPDLNGGTIPAPAQKDS
ncbi:hypothetical protein [Arthrobacter psychrochitiniphilus]|uniref:Cell division protein FtsL n=1 Tax=Arthrobacter psychrochitiniphilus TaxID=291045 RepID=A0A2V3DXV3_9MICC|nr:hypothetical protein [Arthrobacter psychrochitiniphilus]NYG17308.1 hypothetical protein [Arthrobacter psychrochitiniphilus]PXA65427.1 hypothetical protein CVS29_09180 [Arthrobacter psychrochitiniphilus]